MKTASTETDPDCTLHSGRGRTAFTLIEMLVVIAIIALLASLIVPVTTKALHSARKAKCVSNLRQIGIGMVQYRLDNDSIPTRGGPSTDSFWMWDGGGPTYLGRIYQDYVTDFNVFYCPGQEIRADYFVQFGMKQFRDQQWGKQNILSTYVQRGEGLLPGEVMGWSDWAIAACCRHGNSLIPHDGKGPNVLYLDSSVRWLKGNQDNNYRPSVPSTVNFWEEADEG